MLTSRPGDEIGRQRDVRVRSRRCRVTAAPLRIFARRHGWVPVEAADGVIDSHAREVRDLDLDGLAPGEHLLVIRAADSANNTGLAKVVLR